MLKLIKLISLLSILGSTNLLASLKDRSILEEGIRNTKKSEDLTLYKFVAHADQKYKFYVQSGLHGNEKGAVNFTRWLMNRIRTNSGPWQQFRTDASIEIVPVANPAGYAANSRYNSAGVNLNRNFNVLHGMTKENPGNVPFSETETKSIRGLFKSANYTGAVDIHGYINWIVGPSNPFILGNFSEKSPKKIRAYKQLMKILEQQATTLTKYELKTAGGLGDGGSFEDWAFWSAGVPAFCLEISKDQNKEVFLSYEKFIINTFNQMKNIDSQNNENIATN